MSDKDYWNFLEGKMLDDERNGKIYKSQNITNNNMIDKDAKERVLNSVTLEWETCGHIAKLANVYPLMAGKILKELLEENKIESEVFSARTKYRKIISEVSPAKITTLQSTLRPIQV